MVETHDEPVGRSAAVDAVAALQRAPLDPVDGPISRTLVAPARRRGHHDRSRRAPRRRRRRRLRADLARARPPSRWRRTRSSARRRSPAAHTPSSTNATRPTGRRWSRSCRAAGSRSSLPCRSNPTATSVGGSISERPNCARAQAPPGSRPPSLRSRRSWPHTATRPRPSCPCPYRYGVRRRTEASITGSTCCPPGSNCSPTTPGPTLAARADAVAAAALAHRHYPYASMVDDARRAGRSLAAPSVLLSYEQADEIVIGGLVAEHDVLSNGAAVTDLTFFVQVQGDDVHLAVEYRGAVVGEAPHDACSTPSTRRWSRWSTPRCTASSAASEPPRRPRRPAVRGRPRHRRHRRHRTTPSRPAVTVAPSSAATEPSPGASSTTGRVRSPASSPAAAWVSAIESSWPSRATPALVAAILGVLRSGAAYVPVDPAQPAGPGPAQHRAGGRRRDRDHPGVTTPRSTAPHDADPADRCADAGVGARPRCHDRLADHAVDPAGARPRRGSDRRTRRSGLRDLHLGLHRHAASRHGVAGEPHLEHRSRVPRLRRRPRALPAGLERGVRQLGRRAVLDPGCRRHPGHRAPTARSTTSMHSAPSSNADEVTHTLMVPSLYQALARPLRCVGALATPGDRGR